MFFDCHKPKNFQTIALVCRVNFLNSFGICKVEFTNLKCGSGPVMDQHFTGAKCRYLEISLWRKCGSNEVFHVSYCPFYTLLILHWPKHIFKSNLFGFSKYILWISVGFTDFTGIFVTCDGKKTTEKKRYIRVGIYVVFVTLLTFRIWKAIVNEVNHFNWVQEIETNNNSNSEKNPNCNMNIQRYNLNSFGWIALKCISSAILYKETHFFF